MKGVSNSFSCIFKVYFEIELYGYKSTLRLRWNWYPKPNETLICFLQLFETDQQRQQDASGRALLRRPDLVGRADTQGGPAAARQLPDDADPQRQGRAPQRRHHIGLLQVLRRGLRRSGVAQAPPGGRTLPPQGAILTRSIDPFSGYF